MVKGDRQKKGIFIQTLPTQKARNLMSKIYLLEILAPKNIISSKKYPVSLLT